MLKVARLDGSVTHTLAEPWENSAFEILGFSPDSKHLLFHHGDIPEDRPLDSTFEPRFILVTLDPFSSKRVEGPEAFREWSTDPGVVFGSGRALGQEVLLAFNLETGHERLVQALEDTQMDFVGDVIAYTAGSPSYAPSSSSQIRTVEIGGASQQGRSATRSWAHLQWPHLSTDRKHLAYCERDTLRVVGLDATTDLTFRVPSRWADRHHTLKQVCGVGRAGWLSPSEFLYIDESNDHLWKVDLTTSQTEVVQRFVHGLAIAGVVRP